MRRVILVSVGIASIVAGIVLATDDVGAPVAPPPQPSWVLPAATLPTRVASPPPSATPTPAIPSGYTVRIPRLGIDLPIQEGDVDRDAIRQQTPEHFAFHLPGTALPGDGRNCYLYAHARTGMFLSLWNARQGDEVLIGSPGGGTLRYLVSEVHPRVPPDDVSWTAPTSSERLTLQTSTGPNAGDPRFVVIATPG